MIIVYYVMELHKCVFFRLKITFIGKLHAALSIKYALHEILIRVWPLISLDITNIIQWRR